MFSNIGTARANQIIVLLRFAVLISTISSANANTTLSAEESIELRIHQESLEKSIETTTTAGTKSPVKTETIPATTTTTKQMAKTTTPAPVMAALSPDFVPFDKWHCGSGIWNKALSHQLAEDDCPKRMYEANMCCLVHDICYTEEDKTQEECDVEFCRCLRRTLHEAAEKQGNHTEAKGCDTVATSYCNLVQIFGSMAYVDSRPKPTTTSPPPTTSTTPSPSVVSTTTKAAAQLPPVTVTTAKPTPIASTSVTPAQLGHYVMHNVSVHCYDEALSDCVEEMHQCASAGAGAFSAAVDDVPTTNSANEHNQKNGDDQNNNKTTKKQHLPLNGPPSCSARFCACSIKAVSARLAANPGHTQDDERCVESMQTICLQIIEHSIANHNGAVGGKNLIAAVDENVSAKKAGNMHFWSLHVHYPSPSPSPAAPTVVVGVGNGNEQQSVVYHPRQLTHRTASSYWEEKKSAFGIEHMLFASFFLFALTSAIIILYAFLRICHWCKARRVQRNHSSSESSADCKGGSPCSKFFLSGSSNSATGVNGNTNKSFGQQCACKALKAIRSASISARRHTLTFGHGHMNSNDSEPKYIHLDEHSRKSSGSPTEENEFVSKNGAASNRKCAKNAGGLYRQNEQQQKCSQPRAKANLLAAAVGSGGRRGSISQHPSQVHLLSAVAAASGNNSSSTLSELSTY